MVLGGLLTIGFAVRRLIWGIYSHPNNTLGGQSIYCVDAESTAPTISTQETPNGNAIHITPAMLWYYMYTVGLGIFCLGYTLHNAHFTSSFCLCLSSMACALWLVIKEDTVGWDQPFAPKKIVMAALIVMDFMSVLLCLLQFSWLIKPETFWRGVWRNWVTEIMLPMLTPFWVTETRHKTKAMQVPSEKLVLFGLPFVGVLSAGFLTLYIQLQDCSSPLMWVWLNGIAPCGNSSSGDLLGGLLQLVKGKDWEVLPLLARNTILSQNVLELSVGILLVPCTMYAALVLYTGAFLKPENLMVCMQALWLVFTSRQALTGSPDSTLYLAAAVIALLSWLVCILYLLLHVNIMETSNAVRWQGVYDDLECLGDEDKPAERATP